MSSTDTEEILQNAEDTLDTARMGLEMYKEEDGSRSVACGLRNVAAFGRSVTLVLQKLRSKEEGFDDWYNGYVEEMREDPLMEYFVTLRNEVLKEGHIDPSPVVEIEKFNPAKMREKCPPPPGASQLIIGDATDGNSSYWLVEREDGEDKKFYIDPPNIETSYRFPDPPDTHLDEQIEDSSVLNLSEKYLSYLERMVQDAKRRFLG